MRAFLVATAATAVSGFAAAPAQGTGRAARAVSMNTAEQVLRARPCTPTPNPREREGREGGREGGEGGRAGGREGGRAGGQEGEGERERERGRESGAHARRPQENV